MVRPSYVDGTSDAALLSETIGQYFDRITTEVPDNEALASLHQGLRYSYSELHRQVELAARGLMALGVGKGDRVGIWSPNNAECDRQDRSGECAKTGMRHGFHSAFRRGWNRTWAYGAWRIWLYLGVGQCGAEGLRGVPIGLFGG